MSLRKHCTPISIVHRPFASMSPSRTSMEPNFSKSSWRKPFPVSSTIEPFFPDQISSSAGLSTNPIQFRTFRSWSLSNLQLPSIALGFDRQHGIAVWVCLRGRMEDRSKSNGNTESAHRFDRLARFKRAVRGIGIVDGSTVAYFTLLRAVSRRWTPTSARWLVLLGLFAVQWNIDRGGRGGARTLWTLPVRLLANTESNTVLQTTWNIHWDPFGSSTCPDLSFDRWQSVDPVRRRSILSQTTNTRGQGKWPRTLFHHVSRHSSLLSDDIAHSLSTTCDYVCHPACGHWSGIFDDVRGIVNQDQSYCPNLRKYKKARWARADMMIIGVEKA